MTVCFIGFVYLNTAMAERSDRDQPVHLEADQATIEDINRKEDSRVSVFTGNVILTQGTLRISADKVIMQEGNDGFRYATATGNLVSFRQKRDGLDEYVEGWGKRVKYDTKHEKIELFRKAHLKRGADEVKGDYISYDMTSEFFQVKGSTERGVNTESNNRVRITIQPRNKSDESDKLD